MKHELQSIISGKSEVRYGTTIQAIASYLRRSKETSQLAKDSKQYKIQETKILKKYISENNLFFDDVDMENYISEGAEQKVYFKDGKTVIKLNDSIFFNSWEDYFNNLLCHNFFFPDTAYNFLGFYIENSNLHSAVSQSFITSTSSTNLKLVKKFMEDNGFINTRNNDYYNEELGVILEDLHDENVLSKNDVLHFIDTVFYLTPNFYTNK